ncbi:MAG: hypothetical protein LBS90_08835 [Oscillospiraceae bacterium]|jgi:hypothetical protein|nr:hypothetical protein [Oscillospiraceae bacterium]
MKSAYRVIIIVSAVAIAVAAAAVALYIFRDELCALIASARDKIAARRNIALHPEEYIDYADVDL